ncbi:OST-HTH/LOTUS domain-containing protein [Cupriavidus basilensis]
MKPPRPCAAAAAANCARIRAWCGCCGARRRQCRMKAAGQTLGGMGNHIAKQAPEFDSRNYGYGKLSGTCGCHRPV